MDPKNVKYHVSTDFSSLPTHDKTLWSGFNFREENGDSQGGDVETFGAKNIGDEKLIKNDVFKHVIVGLGTVESSFLRRCTKSISDHNHPDLPALHVYLKYLTQLEGPMWKKIRGLGLSYGYGMRLNIDEGQLYFSLTKSTDIFKAYKASQEIVESYLKGDEKWDSALIESAKTSLIYDLVQEEDTLEDAVGLSFINSLRGLDNLYKTKLFSAISQVTETDLTRVGNTYVKNVFAPNRSSTSIVCHTSKVENVAKGFNDLGNKLEVLKSLDDSFLSQF